MTGEVWDPWRLVILVLIALFSHAQITRRSLGPVETCNSDQKDAVLHAITTDEGCDPQGLVILMIIALFYIHKTTAEV